MAATQSVGSGNTGDKKEEKKEEQSSSSGTYECNICLDTAKEPVVSLCGHLFCWPCLHQWLETRPQSPSCPVCKAAISKEKVVPLYGRGNDTTEDPRNKAPPRPQGQRTEPEPQNSFMNGFGFGEGGFQFHLGVGAFPFGFFTLMNGRRAGQGPIPQGQLEGDRFLSSVFMLMGMFFVMWLIII